MGGVRTILNGVIREGLCEEVTFLCPSLKDTLPGGREQCVPNPNLVPGGARQFTHVCEMVTSVNVGRCGFLYT